MTTASAGARPLGRLASFVLDDHRYVLLGTSVIAAMGMSLSSQPRPALSFLAGAYALILTTPSPIEIIGRVIPIALLILFGTMFFFSSCSVVLLQALKRNDRYYYKARNFISVSGLIYRLKQNAKGLSNICILSTIVMVLATTTMALYVGQQEMISFRFPMETKIVVSNTEDVSQMLPQTVLHLHEALGTDLLCEP